MFTTVQRRPSVRVYQRGCDSNLPEECFTLNIGTLNTRTLYNNDSKLEHLLNEMTHFKIDILGISETHWSLETLEAFEKSDYTIIHSGRNDNIHRQGVALILHKGTAEHLKGYELVSERLLVIQLETSTDPLFIFQVYAPDSTYIEEEVEAFYETLQDHINKLPRKRKLVLLGDFNAKVGQQSHTVWPRIVGKFCVGDKNSNGEKLLQLCAINQFSIMNTLYQQPRHRLVTWTSPDRRTQSQLDFIIVPSDSRNQVKKCRVYNSFDVDSDHSLVMMKYTMKKKKPKKFSNVSTRFAVEKLQDVEIKDAFQIKIGGAFHQLMEKDDISLEEMYNSFTQCVNTITNESVGKRRRKLVDGMSAQTAALCEERRKARITMLADPSNVDAASRYKTLNKEVKRAVKMTKIRKMEEKVKQIESDYRENKTHNLFQNVRDLEGKPKKPLMAVKDNLGNKKTNIDDTLSIWKNHFHRHLNKAFPREEEMIDKIEIPNCNNEEFTIEKDQIAKAIKALKSRKAPGHDGITAEVLKAGGEQMIDMSHKIFNRVLEKKMSLQNGQRC